MDYDRLGRPKDGYGVSNQARRRFGPPRFDEAKFTVNQPTVACRITVEY